MNKTLKSKIRKPFKSAQYFRKHKNTARIPLTRFHSTKLGATYFIVFTPLVL